MVRKMVLSVVLMLLLLGCTTAYAYQYYGSSTPQPITDEMVAKARAAGVSVIGNGVRYKNAPVYMNVDEKAMVCAEKSGYSAATRPASAVQENGKAVYIAPPPPMIDPQKAADVKYVSSMAGAGGGNAPQEKQGFSF
jgi:hypothetical protein